MTEQDERIREGLRDFYANPSEYSLQDLEDIFEDADPTLYL